ncbi:hypothetical protein U9M48_045014, partial [Paspalum notatum var. saurae]
ASSESEAWPPAETRRRAAGATAEFRCPSDLILCVRLMLCGGLTTPIDLDFCGGPAVTTTILILSSSYHTTNSPEATLPSSFLGDALALPLPPCSGNDDRVVPRLDTDTASGSDSIPPKLLPLSSPHTELLPSLPESEALSLLMCRMGALLLSFSTTLYANIWNGTSQTRGAASPACHAGSLLSRFASMSR